MSLPRWAGWSGRTSGLLPAPELPRFDVFVMDGVRDIGWTDLPCNFVQIMENAVDPHHTEWLHGRFFEFMARHQGFDAPASFGKKHVKVGFDAFEWGIIKRRVVEGASEEDDDWKIGHPLVFPYNMRVGGANIEQMQIRVPIDRTTTRFMLYTVHAPGRDRVPRSSRRCLTTRSRSTTPTAGTGWITSRGRT